MILKNYNLAIVGLGYVGLPLAVSFNYKRNTIGFDINEDRIKGLGIILTALMKSQKNL